MTRTQRKTRKTKNCTGSETWRHGQRAPGTQFWILMILILIVRVSTFNEDAHFSSFEETIGVHLNKAGVRKIWVQHSRRSSLRLMPPRRISCVTLINSSGQKRARSHIEDVSIPPEDCTRDTFDQHANLKDRQFLCWALQTEARIRFAKLEGRDNSFGQETTLNSEYLLDLYPTTDVEKEDTWKLARERHAYARKSFAYLQTMRDPDISFEFLTRLEIHRPQSNDLKKKRKCKGPAYISIPPNVLYFELILEAFMSLSFHSEDLAQPRAAVMGHGWSCRCRPHCLERW